MDGSDYYAEDLVRKTHVTNPFLRNEALDIMFWSGTSIFLIVLVKKEYLKPGSIEGSHYYANARVREMQVTNHFFTKRNIGYNVLECEQHISNCICQKRIPRTGEHRRLPLLC